MCGQTDKGCVSARFKLPERNASGMRLHLWRGDQLLSTNMKELLLWLCPCVASYVQSPSRSFWARLPACELSCTSSCACGCDCESTLETVFAGKAHLIAVTPPPPTPHPSISVGWCVPEFQTTSTITFSGLYILSKPFFLAKELTQCTKRGVLCHKKN